MLIYCVRRHCQFRGFKWSANVGKWGVGVMVCGEAGLGRPDWQHRLGQLQHEILLETHVLKEVGSHKKKFSDGDWG